MLLEFFMGDVGVQFDLFDVLLFCSEGLGNLNKAFSEFDDLLYSVSAQSFGFLGRFYICVEVWLFEVLIEGGFDFMY
jgi:hypothetical protein